MKWMSIFAILFAISVHALDKEYANDPVCLIKTTQGDIYIELFAEEAPETVKNFLGLAEGTKEFTDAAGQKVKGNFYDGLIFHRVINNFMIQGGCPQGNGMGDPGYKFQDEINADDLGLSKAKAFDGQRPHPSLGIRSQQDFQRMILYPVISAMGISNEEQFRQHLPAIQKAVMELTLKQCFENLGYQYNDKLKSHKPDRGVIAMANSGPNTNGSQFFINVIETPWLAGKHTVFGKVLKGMDIVDKISKVQVGPGSKPVEDVKIISIRKFDGEVPAEETAVEVTTPEETAVEETTPKAEKKDPETTEKKDPETTEEKVSETTNEDPPAGNEDQN